MAAGISICHLYNGMCKFRVLICLEKFAIKVKYRRTNGVINRRKQGKPMYKTNKFLLLVRVYFDNTRRTTKRVENVSHATLL